MLEQQGLNVTVTAVYPITQASQQRMPKHQYLLAHTKIVLRRPSLPALHLLSALWEGGLLVIGSLKNSRESSDRVQVPCVRYMYLSMGK